MRALRSVRGNPTDPSMWSFKSNTPGRHFFPLSHLLPVFPLRSANPPPSSPAFRRRLPEPLGPAGEAHVVPRLHPQADRRGRQVSSERFSGLCPL